MGDERSTRSASRVFLVWSGNGRHYTWLYTKLSLHFFDLTDRILPYRPAEIGETRGGERDSGLLRFVLGGGLLLLDLLLPQGFRQQSLELLILKLPFGLDELRLVP